MSHLVLGCGDLGGRVAARWHAAGLSVHGVRRGGPVPTGVEPLLVDLLDAAAVATAPWPAEVTTVLISLTAGRGPDEARLRACYLEAPLAALEALERSGSRPQRVVHISSTSVYGESAGEWVDEETPTTAEDLRGRMQREAEAGLRERLGARLSILRLGGIYGPGRTWLLDRVRRGEGQVTPEEPPRWTNRIHVEDAAAAVFHLAELASPPKLVLGVDREPVPRHEVEAWLAQRCNAAAAEGTAAPSRGSGRASNKRCRSDRLASTGFHWRFPTYREGYGALLAAEES